MKVWKTFTLAGSEPPEQLLRTQLRSDARIVFMEHTARFDRRAIDPYALYVLYRVRGVRVEVLGTLRGHEILEHNGIFLHDLKWQLGSLFSPSPDSSPASVLFYFPGRVLPEREAETREATAIRTDWLLCIYNTGDTALPLHLSPEEEALSVEGMNKVMRALESRYHIPSSACDVSRIRARFDVVRMRAERLRFFKRFLAFRTERDLRPLMEFNGEVPCEGDALDLQCFYRRFGVDHAPPTFFFRAPLEEVPPEVASLLPLHRGGLLHLSYLDVPPWLWNRYEIAQQRRAVLEGPYEAPEWLEALAARVFSCVSGFDGGGWRRGEKRGGGEWAPRSSSSSLTLNSGALLECLPPCVRGAFTGHFPKNRERVLVVPVLAAGGVSMEAATELFRETHAAFPNGETFHARFNVKGVWARNYGPVSCKTIILGEKELACPYVKQTQTRESWANRCCCRREAGIPDIEEMYAPHMFLAAKLKGKGEEGAKRVKIPEMESSEEEEEEEMEEEW